GCDWGCPNAMGLLKPRSSSSVQGDTSSPSALVDRHTTWAPAAARSSPHASLDAQRKDDHMSTTAASTTAPETANWSAWHIDPARHGRQLLCRKQHRNCCNGCSIFREHLQSERDL